MNKGIIELDYQGAVEAVKTVFVKLIYIIRKFM